MRLLTDTCSAIKLFALGGKLFAPGILKKGDLILHPRVFSETRQWPLYKKKKYENELAELAKLKATTGLRPPKDEFENLQNIIFSTMDEIGTPIGAADRDQLASAIYASAEIVTNDSPFRDVAEALDVAVHTAERIVIEAHSIKAISADEVKKAMQTWISNDEKSPSKEDQKALDSISA